MLDYDEWFEKHGFEIDDETSFDAYEDYISEYPLPFSFVIVIFSTLACCILLFLIVKKYSSVSNLLDASIFFPFYIIY